MNNRRKMIKDEVVNLLYLYSRGKYSYTVNILVDKRNGRKYYSAEDIYNLPGTVIKNKKKYLDANSVMIEIIEDGISIYMDKFIPEYNFLSVILKSTVSTYRALAEWILEDVTPNVNKRLLEEEPIEAKFNNTGNTIADRIITQVEDVLNKFKDERKEDE